MHIDASRDSLLAICYFCSYFCGTRPVVFFFIARSVVRFLSLRCINLGSDVSKTVHVDLSEFAAGLDSMAAPVGRCIVYRRFLRRHRIGYS